jgi:hypothetical protein
VGEALTYAPRGNEVSVSGGLGQEENCLIRSLFGTFGAKRLIGIIAKKVSSDS